MQGQLFTQDFLLRGIRDTPPYQSIDAAALSRFRVALEFIYQPLRADSNLNEAQTEQLIIERVLVELGGGDDYLPQVNLSGKRREDVPDILLFLDSSKTLPLSGTTARRTTCWRSCATWGQAFCG